MSYSGTNLINDETALPTAQYIAREPTSFNGEVSNRFAMLNGDLNVGVDFFSDTADIRYDSLVPERSYIAGEELSNVGVFAQLRLEPTENTRLSTGLRADFQNFTGIDGSTQSTDGLSFNASGEIDVTEHITFGAGYSHVWGGIELAENYIFNPRWDYAVDPIEDVTSDNIYVALSYTAGTWAVDGKAFSTEIDNARAAGFRSGPAVTTDVSSTGFEIGFSKNWNDGFVRIGYANIDTEIDGEAANSFTGNYLTIPLGKIISLQAAHEFSNGVVFGGDAQIALDYDKTNNLVGGSPNIAGYTVVNTFVEYSPGQIEGLSLRAEINNIFDKKYVSRATYGQDFVGQVVPLSEAGRSLRLTATMARYSI